MNPPYNYSTPRYATPSPRVGWQIIHSTIAKMVVGTICTIVLFRYLQSLSKDEALQEKAKEVSTFGKNAYNVYQDFKQPIRQYNRYETSRN